MIVTFTIFSTENLFIREAMGTEFLIGKNDSVKGIHTFLAWTFMHHLL
jgi:hypothetical protein